MNERKRLEVVAKRLSDLSKTMVLNLALHETEIVAVERATEKLKAGLHNFDESKLKGKAYLDSRIPDKAEAG